MEITPESLNFAGVDHVVDDLVGVLGLSFHAPVAAFDDLFVAENALVLKIADDPFAEVEAPVDEGVCHCGSGFAVSGKMSAWINLGISFFTRAETRVYGGHY